MINLVKRFEIVGRVRAEGNGHSLHFKDNRQDERPLGRLLIEIAF